MGGSEREQREPAEKQAVSRAAGTGAQLQPNKTNKQTNHLKEQKCKARSSSAEREVLWGEMDSDSGELSEGEFSPGKGAF